MCERVRAGAGVGRRAGGLGGLARGGAAHAARPPLPLAPARTRSHIAWQLTVCVAAL